MKTSFLFLLLVLSGVAVPKTAVRDVTWNDVHEYIAAEASFYDCSTEAELWIESEAGQRSWEVEGGARQARLDGVGVGWPHTGEVIEFPTQAKANQCAALIDAYRESR